jgi:hypothetical protein
MADQRHQKFEALREAGSFRLNSTSTVAAQVERIYVETHELPTAAARPPHATAAVRALGFTPGQVHPKNAYAFLVGAELVAMNDTHEVWQTLWKVDMKAYATAAGLTWPDMLAKDRYSRSNQFGTGSTGITWVFDVVNPDSYVEPAQDGTIAHPLDTDAKLVGETVARNGIEARVTRRYEILAELYDHEFDEETNDPVTITRQIVASTTVPDTPDPGTSVSQRALGTGYSLRVTRQITGGGVDGVPTSYSYRDNIDFYFPRLLTRIDTYTDGSDFRFSPIIRAGYRKKVVARIDVDFHLTQPADSVVIQLQPTDWNYAGFTFNVQEYDIITDEWDFSNIGGAVIETWTGEESSPTYTEYLALVGDWHRIAEQIKPWKYNLWRRAQIYIIPE